MKLIVVDLKLKTAIHAEEQGNHYTLMDLLLYGEQNEWSPIFVACYSLELSLII